MELSQLKAFIAVADARGFAAAASALNVAPSSITRAVAKLEESIGVRLFHRTTRSVTLTEAGLRFRDRIAPALDEIEAAVDHVDVSSVRASGQLRVAASVSFGQKIIAPALLEFTNKYPAIRVELVLSDSLTDIVSERIDVAVRHGILQDSSMIARRLSDVRYRLVAAPAYLKKAKTLKSPLDLSQHSCLTFPYDSFRTHWRFTKKDKQLLVPVEPVVTLSNAVALSTCVQSGMGISLLADWLINDDLERGNLVEVLPTWAAAGSDFELDASLWVVTPSRQFVPSKTKAFVSFLEGII